jgi:hypothetical protein
MSIHRITAILALLAPFPALAQRPPGPGPDPAPARVQPTTPTVESLLTTGLKPAITGISPGVFRYVFLDGRPLAAHPEIEISAEPKEVRSGADGTATLVPGPRRFAVCLVSQARIAPLDPGLLTLDPKIQRHEVRTEEGIGFKGCLVSGLRTRGPARGRSYTYCLRCARAQ